MLLLHQVEPLLLHFIGLFNWGFIWLLIVEKALGHPKLVPWSPLLSTCLGTQYFWKKLQYLKFSKQRVPHKLRKVTESFGCPIDADF